LIAGSFAIRAWVLREVGASEGLSDVCRDAFDGALQCLKQSVEAAYPGVVVIVGTAGHAYLRMTSKIIFGNSTSNSCTVQHYSVVLLHVDHPPQTNGTNVIWDGDYFGLDSEYVHWSVGRTRRSCFVMSSAVTGQD